MRDGIGNRIVEGALLLWRVHNLIYRVVRVSDGGLSVVSADGKSVTPPQLTLELDLPLQPMKAGQEAQLGEFLCVVNPAATEAVEKMLEKRPS